jgi:hypothetical protein
VGHGIVKRLLSGGQNGIESRLGGGVSQGELAFETSYRRGQRVDRRRVVRLHGRRQRLLVGPQAGLNRLVRRVLGRKDGKSLRLLGGRQGELCG